MSDKSDDLEQLRRALIAVKKLRAKVNQLEASQQEAIAIVGIGVRFPGDNDTPAKFWQFVQNGGNAVSEVPANRWDINEYYDSTADAPGKMRTKYAAFIDHVDQFDPHFFGISPREAVDMDPQQRIVLEIAWEALEDAGIIPTSLAGSKTGVFIGIGLNDYGDLQTPAHAFDPSLINNYTLSGNALCITANRLSYVLDLRGPSMGIDTACSSSLVAVHQACHSLRRGELQLALAGGVNLILKPETSVALTNFQAPDGRCKTFDARADGYTRGEGAGIIVLKRLSDALADGDSIYATIRGSAINQDGYSSGLTVPNGVAQQEMLHEALQNAGVQPDWIDYVEAHGTGTSLGDPIEAGALDAVLRNGRSDDTPCLIGSVKTNIGHLEAGAGIAGLIKAALALKHKEIPPSLHYETPNPHIPFEQMRLKVVTELTPWPKRDHPRLAGVSSFGFGGTNAHTILEEAPTIETNSVSEPEQERPYHILTFSAKSEPALRDLASAYAQTLTETAVSLADVAYTANTKRSQFTQRMALLGATSAEILAQLTAVASGDNPADTIRGQVERETPSKIAFLFTGQGAQYLHMGRQLYETQPLFRKTVDKCAQLVQPYLDKPLLSVIYAEDDGELINQTAYTQPALFAIEYALTELWRSWGIEPDALIGHSVGEYVAACVAGVFTLEDGLRLIAERGRVMQALPTGGGMTAVFATKSQVKPFLADYPETVSIAAINGPTNIVISGVATNITQIEVELKQAEIKFRPLTVSHAFHSPLMESALAEFGRVAQQISYARPKIPLIANLTGQFWQEGTQPDAVYWQQHLRQAVQFNDGMQTLQTSGYDIFLEIGPAPTLLAMGLYCLPENDALWLPSLHPDKEDWQQILSSLGQLFAVGIDVDWLGFDADYARQQTSVPTYPWQRQRYWFSKRAERFLRDGQLKIKNSLHPLLDEKLQSPALTDDVFKAQIDLESLPYLADHRVFDKVVFPATAYLEMAHAAATAVLGANQYEITDILIQEALLLDEETPQAMQIVCKSEEETELSFQIFSAGKQNEQWQRHVSGRIAVASPATEKGDDKQLEKAQQACGQPLSVNDFYQALRVAGLQYGPHFQAVTQLWRGDQQALGHIHLPQSLLNQTGAYHIHPVLLDACLQVVAALLPWNVAENGHPTEVYLPLGLDKFLLLHPPETTMWSHARIHEQKGETAKGDITLFNDVGEVVALIQGIHLKRASRQALRQITLPKESVADWLYQIEWQSKPLTDNASATTAGHWLILADDGDVGTHFAQQLQAAGGRCHLLRFAEIEQNMAAWSSILVDDGPFTDVIHLWSLNAHMDTYTLAQLQAAQAQIGGSLLSLVQAVFKTGTAVPKLWVVTQGAQAIDDTTPIALAQAPVWGMMRTVALENPELQPVMIDLDEDTASDDLSLLLNEVLANDGEDHVAFRNDERLTARLTRRISTPFTDQHPVQLTITERGVLDNLTLTPATRQPPAPNEVEIRVRATGLNFRDVLNALGMYPGKAGLLGNECAGEVVAVGADVEHLQIGDAVIALGYGTFSTYLTTNAQLVIVKPDRLSYAQAATIPITFLTAHLALNHLAKLQAGERVLIHAAAGGVGMAAVQLAVQVGAELLGTAGNPEKRALLQSLGVDHVMNSRTLDFGDEIMQITEGEGVDVILNSLADEFIAQSFAVLQENGRFLEIGKRGIWDEAQVAALGKSIEYHVIYLGNQMEENPAFIQQMLQELMVHFESGALRPLPMHTFPLAQAETAYRFMAQAKHVGKIVLVQTDTAVAEQATYLVTGGLRGIGWLVAQRLVTQGAKHLVLLGRSTPDDAVQEQIEKWEGDGCQIRVAQTDVANENEMTAVMTQIKAEMPPLRGVVHAAGVLADRVFIQQTWQNFKTVLAPKMAGSWLLHQMTQDEALDFFVLFSAGASLIGSPGQSNYALANSFQDGLAHWRQTQGLPALSIDWGPWLEVGMAANMTQQDQARMFGQGLGGIRPKEGMDIWQGLLGDDAAQVAVLPIDWSLYQARYKDDVPSLMIDLVQAARMQKTVVVSAPEHSSILQTLADAAESKKRTLLLGFIREQANKVLGLENNHTIDARQPLNEMGLDSLMAVELRNNLSQNLTITLPPTLLFDYPTVGELTDYLWQIIRSVETESGEIESDSPAEDELTNVLAELEHLSDDEAEAMLLAELESLNQGNK